jgi:hypothetical protein
VLALGVGAQIVDGFGREERASHGPSSSVGRRGHNGQAICS